MKSIKITAQYPIVKIKDGDLMYEVEKNWVGRPAWIKISRCKKPAPRFLSIEVPRCGEFIYKAFGRYYCPVDYTNKEEQRFMDAMAEEYDGMVADMFNIPMAKSLLSQLPLKKLKKDIHILDMGCGTGIMVKLLVKKGFFRFTLVDFSKNMLVQAKKKLGNSKAIKYEKVDIIKKMPKGVFDAAVSVMLFNTFNDKIIDLILSRLVKQMSKKAIFGIIEDTERSSYTKYFHPIINKMVDVGDRTKYIFVGIKK